MRDPEGSGGAPVPIRFAFDPLCPWCYQTSRWVRRLEELGEVRITWGLFSLDVANRGNDATRDKAHDRGAPGLRTAVLVRERHGNAAMGRFYEALGRRVHEEREPADGMETLAGALKEIEVDEALAREALADDATWRAVEEEHRALVEGKGGFGVPTIVLDDGDGPAVFGPVISNPPDDDETAVALWHHVSWLARYENFSELKRESRPRPDLPAFAEDR